MNKRQREDSDEEEEDRPTKRSTHPSPLRAFLERHLGHYGRDRRLDNHAFTMSRVLHYDTEKEWGLFYTFDLISGRGTFDWWRSHYALGTRLIRFGQDHRPGCSGRAAPHEKPHSWIGRVLRECSCPLKPFKRMQEWRVSPSGISVTLEKEKEEIWRGKPVVAKLCV
jgi:hypothetical protein